VKYAAFLLLLSSPAFAQSGADRAAAEALFNDAIKLIEAKKHPEACPKLAESQRLDPGVGVMLYLADCWEQTGKPASAWVQFREAEDLATRQNDPKRAEIARARAAKLLPDLPRLVIRAPAGAEVKRDDALVGAAQLGVLVPIDPGSHVITARAPGKKPWTKTIEVPARKADVEVAIPPLEDEPVPVAPPPKPAAVTKIVVPPRESSGQRTAAIVVSGAGILALGAGVFFGLQARGQLDDSNAGHCREGNLCDAEGVALRDDAKGSAMISTVAFGVGAAALIGGAVLWLTAPKTRTVGVTGIRVQF
jgi:hypothetical protein